MRIFSYDEIDELGEGLIRQYLGEDAEQTYCVDIEGFVTDFLKLPLLYRTFAEHDTDKIGFIADGITPLQVYENQKPTKRVYPKGTIVIERYLRQEHESGRRRFTISHAICDSCNMDEAAWMADTHHIDSDLLCTDIKTEFCKLLTDSQRSVFIECLIEGKSQTEFALDHRISIPMVNKQIRAIRKKAKKFFTEG